MKKALLILCLALLPSLGACDTIRSYLPGCDKDVAGLRIGLTAAKSLALVYVSKPLCGSPSAGQICSQIFIVNKIHAARDQANIAVNAASSACSQDLLSAAHTALDAFTQIVNVVTPPKTVAP